jgi:hypothetical protein
MDDFPVWPARRLERAQALARRAQVARSESLATRARADEVVAKSRHLRAVGRMLLATIANHLRP